MKTRFKLMGLLGLGALLGGGVGCAGTEEAGRDVTAALPLIEQTTEGVILKVDPQANAIAVRQTPDDRRVPEAWFKIDANTTVVDSNGNRASLSELQEGTPVRVDFEPATGAEKTFKVQVLSGQEAREVQREVQMQ